MSDSGLFSMFLSRKLPNLIQDNALSPAKNDNLSTGLQGKY